LVCFFLFALIVLLAPIRSGFWLSMSLLSINVILGSVIAGVWQSRNSEGWRQIPLLPIRGRWLCYAVCGLLLIPLALFCAITIFVCLLLLPYW
jgi:hypothetical protein